MTEHIHPYKIGFKFAGNPLGASHSSPQSQLSLDLRSDLANTVKSFHLNANAQLIPGDHRVRASERAAIFYVEANTEISLQVSVQSDADGALKLDRAHIVFSQPLHLKNVFTTIDELFELIADLPEQHKPKDDTLLSKAGAYVGSKAGAYIDKITESSAVKFIRDAAERGGLAENIEKSRELFGKSLEKAEEILDSAFDGMRISELEMSSEKGTDGEKLCFYFTGEILLNNIIKRYFDHIKFPETLMPSQDPHLSMLFGKLCVGPEQGANLFNTILEMIESLDGHLTSEMSFFPIPFEVNVRPGRILACSLDINRSIALSSDFQISRESGQFKTELSALFENNQDIQPIHVSFMAAPEAIAVCAQALISGGGQLSMLGHGSDITGRIEIMQGFTLNPEHLSAHFEDGYVRGVFDMHLSVEEMPVSGWINFGIEAASHEIHIHTFDVHASSQMHLSDDWKFTVSGADMKFDSFSCAADLTAKRLQENGSIQVSSEMHIDFDSRTSIKLIELPELRVWSDEASGTASGHLDIFLSVCADDDLSCVRFDGSSCHAECHDFTLVWDRIALKSQSPFAADICIQSASHASSGIENSVFDISWQCAKAPTASSNNKTAAILPQELTGSANAIEVSIDEDGVVHFSGGHGFYDSRFFNALAIPGSEPEKMIEILDSAALGTYLLDLLRIILPDSTAAEIIIQHFVRWRTVSREKGIFSTAKLVHPQNTAKSLSIFLFGDERAESELLPTCQRVMNADGIDRFKLEELIERAFPELSLDNVGRVLRWCHRLFSTVPYHKPEYTHDPALCDNPEILPIIDTLPMANEIYEGDWSDGRIAQRCCKYATGLTLAQLEWIIDNKTDNLSPQDLSKLRQLCDIKSRVHHFRAQEGSFLLHGYNLDVFLNEILQAEEDLLSSPGTDDIAECFRTWLSPADTACLLSSGLASWYRGLFVQTTQAHLLEYLVRRGKTYTIAVFCEMGERSPHTLMSKLMNYLNLRQSALRIPKDKVTILSNLLGVELPRLEDFTPWQKRASESYIKNLIQAAEAIISEGTSYHAALLRMQTRRDETPSFPSSQKTPRTAVKPIHTGLIASAEKALLQAINSADEATLPLLQKILQNGNISDEETAFGIHAWQTAVDKAAEMIRLEPQAFECSSMKTFWSRLNEALRLVSIETDFMNNCDEVRAWLTYRLKKQGNTVDPQTLSRRDFFSAIADNFYVFPEDKALVRTDPLIYFVPRAPKKPVELTVIAAMGVITNGAHGHEFETIFERLHRDYGIRLIRSDTGLVKSLDYNAQRIRHAIRSVKGPFALLGYSQGCANMMRAESSLYTGTPNEQSQLDGLVSRNFVCSALNGSVHTVCGLDKYKNCFIDGENILKGMSAAYSQYMTAIGLGSIQRFLDTPAMNMIMSGLESLGPEGVQSLSRDAQYKPGVVSVETQGNAVSDLPEALVFMKNHFTRQCDIPNDTQVGTDCAHAYPVYNRNDSVDRLYEETIPAKTLNIHHWSPLTEEVDPVYTDQDRENFVYRGPKSFFIQPWIETLIMFGIIK